MHVDEHKVNMWIPIELGASSWDIDEDDVLASSKKRVDRMNSKWLSSVMQWDRDMEIPMDVALVVEH